MGGSASMSRYKHHAWTGIVQPFTSGNKLIHDEIANSQVVHWSPQQIKAAERSGYFADLSRRAQAKRYGSLLDEQEELELE